MKAPIVVQIMVIICTIYKIIYTLIYLIYLNFSKLWVTCRQWIFSGDSSVHIYWLLVKWLNLKFKSLKVSTTTIVYFFWEILECEEKIIWRPCKRCKGTSLKQSWIGDFLFCWSIGSPSLGIREEHERERWGDPIYEEYSPTHSIIQISQQCRWNCILMET